MSSRSHRVPAECIPSGFVVFSVVVGLLVAACSAEDSTGGVYVQDTVIDDADGASPETADHAGCVPPETVPVPAPLPLEMPGLSCPPGQVTGDCVSVGPQSCPAGLVPDWFWGCHATSDRPPPLPPSPTCPLEANDDLPVDWSKLTVVAPNGVGDGTLRAPMGWSEARAQGKTRLRLLPGTYVVDGPLNVDVLVGHCASDTLLILESNLSLEPNTEFFGTGAQVVIAGVSVDLGQHPLLASKAQQLTIRDAVFTGSAAKSAQVRQTRGNLTMRRVHFNGVGVTVTDGTLRVVEALFENIWGNAINGRGATIQVSRSHVRNVWGPTPFSSGRGLNAHRCDSHVETSVFESTTGLGLLAFSGQLSIDRVLVRDSRAGVVSQELESPGTLNARNLTIREVEVGLVVFGSDLSLEHSTIRDLRKATTDAGNFALSAIAQSPDRHSRATIRQTSFDQTRVGSVINRGYDMEVRGNWFGESTVHLRVDTAPGRLRATGNVMDGTGTALFSQLLMPVPDWFGPSGSDAIELELSDNEFIQQAHSPPNAPVIGLWGQKVRLTAQNNLFVGQTGSIVFGDIPGDTILTDNRFWHDHHLSFAVALECLGGQATVDGNTIVSPFGIVLARCHNAVVSENQIRSVQAGVMVCRSESPEMRANTITEVRGGTPAAGLISVGNANAAVAENIITGSDGPGIIVEEGSASFSGNQLLENGHGGLIVTTGAQADFSAPDTVMADNRRFGVACVSGSLTGSGLAVENTRPQAKDGSGGHGLYIGPACTSSMDAVFAEDNRCADLAVDGGQGAITSRCGALSATTHAESPNWDFQSTRSAPPCMPAELPNLGQIGDITGPCRRQPGDPE